MVGAVEDVGGSSVVLAGRTGGDWAAVNAGGSDFAAVKLSADDGSELWRFQVCQWLNCVRVRVMLVSLGFFRYCLSLSKSSVFTDSQQENADRAPTTACCFVRSGFWAFGFRSFGVFYFERLPGVFRWGLISQPASSSGGSSKPQGTK